jgi:hypothetical protein
MLRVFFETELRRKKRQKGALETALASDCCPDVDGVEKVIQVLDYEIRQYNDELRLETLGCSIEAEVTPPPPPLCADEGRSLTN